MTNTVMAAFGAACMFFDMVHGIKYGEETTNDVTVTVTTRMEKAVVLDDDGVTREFVIDNYKLDPPAGFACTKLHYDASGNRIISNRDCPYMAMYLKRYDIYMKRDKLREKWMKEEMERQQNPTGRSTLLNRFRRRVLP